MLGVKTKEDMGKYLLDLNYDRLGTENQHPDISYSIQHQREQAYNFCHKPVWLSHISTMNLILTLLRHKLLLLSVNVWLLRIGT